MQLVHTAPVDPRTAPDVERIVNAAFGSSAEYELIAALRDSDAWIAELSLGGYVDGELVGHALFSDARAGDVPVVVLAPLAVAPAWQRRGVGTALVRAGLEVAGARGAGLALVLGHPGYYPRFGFEPAVPHGILAPYPIEPEEAWMVVALVPGALGEACGTVVLDDVFMDPALWRE